MKASRFLCIAVIVIQIVSCNDTSEKGSTYSGPLSYPLILSFIDTAGNDLVMGIENTESEGSINADFVNPDLYELASSPDLYEVGFYSNPTTIYNDPHRYPRLGLWDLSDISGYSALGLEMSSPQDRDLDKITYTIICPYVFGDDTEHKIVTWWEKPSNWHKKQNMYRVCHRMEIDGIEYTDINYGTDESHSYVTITLDR